MLCKILGHDKEYVAIRRTAETPHTHNPSGKDHEYCKCRHGEYLDHSCDSCARAKGILQEARWVCRRKSCPAMGQDELLRTQGLFKVEFGRLVPDKKSWSSFDGPV